MDSKNRFLTALSNEKPDRVPFNFWMDRRLMEKYEKRIGHRHWRVTHYGADVIETFPLLEFPTGRMEEHTGTSWLKDPVFDDYSAINELIMPDPDDEKVYEIIKRDLDEFPNTAVVLDTQTAWGVIAGVMRGYENVYMDVFQYHDEFKQLCRMITDIQLRVVEKACQMGITALYIMEDVATTKGLVMSPEMIKEYCFSYAREMMNVADSFHVPTMFHCCGKIPDELAAMFIELGVKAINPLQPSVNDTKDFSEKYQNQLAVYGGLDNCFTIPQGSKKDIEDHVFEQFELLGKPYGGLIFSSHDIDINTPDKNIEIMIDSIKKCRY